MTPGNSVAPALSVNVSRCEPSRSLPTGEMLKPGSALIDIGINRVDGKTVGDADFDSCRSVAGWITPVPGGVGPVTVATLMNNAVLATRMQLDHYRSTFASAN